MFLANLSDELKIDYLEIANALISSDNVLAEEELALLRITCYEMGYTEIPKLGKDNINEVLKRLANADYSDRQKMYFELQALALADSIYADEERVFMKKIAESFGISDDKAAHYLSIVKMIGSIYAELNEVMK